MANIPKRMVDKVRACEPAEPARDGPFQARLYWELRLVQGMLRNDVQRIDILGEESE